MNVAMTLSINQKPPFDNHELRRAMALSLDRRAFIEILGEGQGDIGTALLPAPEIMRSLGYGLENGMKLTIMTRNLPDFRDPATILRTS
jgi:peptide/nickel transport system substrate-binding protein